MGSEEFDLLIRGGKILDGAARPWFCGDIGIKSDTVARIGELAHIPSKAVLDAGNAFVCPGFIDIHSHSDLTLLDNPYAKNKLLQGVTTELVGNCGMSAAPFPEVSLFTAELGESSGWPQVGQYLKKLEDVRPAVNVATLVGHASVRVSVMGMTAREATASELRKMCHLVDDAMDQGAYGLSTGLAYAPGSYASFDEIRELVRRVARQGGIYATHLRNEGNFLLEAVKEAIKVAKLTGVSLEISHCKALGKRMFGRIQGALELIDIARSEGLNVAMDFYPYTASATSLSALLPDWALEGGHNQLVARLQDPGLRRRLRGWLAKKFEEAVSPDQIEVCNLKGKYLSLEGSKLSDAAEQMELDPEDAVLELLAVEGGSAGMICFAMSDMDLKQVLKCPYAMVGSDGQVLLPRDEFRGIKVHPRNFGAFPRFLARYVREEGLVSLEEAISRVTSLPARKVGISDRGMLREGMKADIVVFSFEEIEDTATFQRPWGYPQGIKAVIVNGALAVKEGKITGIRAGQVLRFR